MTVKKKVHEREVLLAESLTIEDYEGDTLCIILNYDSTDTPEGAALMQFDLTDTGEKGTWVTPEDLEEMASMLLNVASGIRVAEKKAPSISKDRRRRSSKR